MATIVKRERQGGTVYLVDIRIHGFPRQKKTFKRLTDAKLWAQQTEAAIRKGEFQNVVATARGKTVKDVIDRYREDVLPHKSPSTQRAESTFLAFWERTLGEYALSYVKPDIVSVKLRELGKAGDGRRKKPDDEAADDKVKPTAPKKRKTLKNYRDTLELLFKHAKQWEWIAANPMDGVNRITKIRDERTRFLSDEERSALLDACKASDNEHLYTVVVFALSTGARKGEILGLTLANLDLGRGVAILRETKNGDTRAAPIARHLRELLLVQMERSLSLYAALPHPPKTRWLFPRADGEQPIDIRTAWENARDKAGLVDFRFHDLRHSTASYLAMKGASLVEIAEVLGHRTLQMVRRYSHLSESHVKGLVERLGEDLFQPAASAGKPSA
jgi:integrase